MSAKPETTFYTSIHKHLPIELYRMKTHNPYIGGVPDMWYSGKQDLWIEYKFIVLPKRDSTMIKIELSGLQLDWLKNRHREGRRVQVIVGCKEGGVFFKNLSWEKPIPTKVFRTLLLTRRCIADTIKHTCM